jgi:hypothetical protein
MRRIRVRTIVVCFVFGFYAPVFGVQDGLYKFRPGVYVGQVRSPTKRQLKTLLDGLRFWTGFDEITIDPVGNLNLGDRSRITGGSKTARELIIAAVDSQDSFRLERRDNSSTIAFAQIVSTESYEDDSGRRRSAWELRIDFSDFAELAGNDEARAAFDPAASAVHELVHAILGYFDPTESDDLLGECERHVNKMRLELGLPQREHYYPRGRSASKPDGLTFMQGEIRFIGANVHSGKQKTFIVTFDLDRIFDRSKAKSKAAIQSNLLVQKRALKKPLIAGAGPIP